MQLDKTREPYSIDANALANWVKSKIDVGARTSGKLSQNKLAQILGCTPATISRWKSGKAVDSLYKETLEAIAQFEKISFEEILEKLSPVQEDTYKNSEESDTSLKALVNQVIQDNESLKIDNRLLKFELEELKEFIKLLAEEFRESRTTNRQDQV
jgi:transcriptional regulator with XRE-family HTH domain